MSTMGRPKAKLELTDVERDELLRLTRRRKDVNRMEGLLVSWNFPKLWFSREAGDAMAASLGDPTAHRDSTPLAALYRFAG